MSSRPPRSLLLPHGYSRSTDHPQHAAGIPVVPSARTPHGPVHPPRSDLDAYVMLQPEWPIESGEILWWTFVPTAFSLGPSLTSPLTFSVPVRFARNMIPVFEPLPPATTTNGAANGHSRLPIQPPSSDYVPVSNTTDPFSGKFNDAMSDSKSGRQFSITRKLYSPFYTGRTRECMHYTGGL